MTRISTLLLLTTDELAAASGSTAGRTGNGKQGGNSPAFCLSGIRPPTGAKAFVRRGNFLYSRRTFACESLPRMSPILLNVLPVFILILIGWLIVRTGLLKDGIGDALGDFVFKIAVPVLLFRTIAEANFHGASPFRLWIAYFSGVAVTWAAGHILATKVFKRDSRIGVLAGVSSAFANNVFIGLPLVGRSVGDDGVVALSILLAVHLPVIDRKSVV